MGFGTVLYLCHGLSQSRAFSALSSGLNFDVSGLHVMINGDKGDDGHTQGHIEHQRLSKESRPAQPYLDAKANGCWITQMMPNKHHPHDILITFERFSDEQIKKYSETDLQLTSI